MINVNSADAYDVGIVPAMVAPGETYWRVVRVRHLTPAENRGRHHVFVDIIDERGQPLRDPALAIGWTWMGRRPDEPAPPQPLTKPLQEPAGNVDLAQPGQVTTVWIADPARPSDAVENLHTRHADEAGPGGELWNSIGHHSFYIQYQLTVAPAGHTEEPVGEQPDALAARVAALEAWRQSVARHLRAMAGDV